MTAETSLPPKSEGYVFDNKAQEARRRFAGLSAVFDPGTFRLLIERGVAARWHCLEVGTGSGSVAAWIAECVGLSGYVLATDTDPRFAEELHRPNIEVRRHDITVDPLPGAAFDLVHARLVLIHLPMRDAVLTRMTAALKPGGWLLIEDFDARAMSADPNIDPAERVLKSREAMMRVMESKGVDLRCGRRIAAKMRGEGLVEIGAEARVFRWEGGSPGARIDSANLQQMRAPILASGLVNEAELEADLARLDDPQFAYPSPVMWASWGRRPS
jgi:SAM-dependent methyltransferase